MISDTTRINDIQKEELFQITKADIQMLGEGEKKERKSGAARKELDEMVGLDSVKTVIHKAIAKHKINKLCMEKGLQRVERTLFARADFARQVTQIGTVFRPVGARRAGRQQQRNDQ